jgi:hypothetical protein
MREEPSAGAHGIAFELRPSLFAFWGKAAQEIDSTFD